jgi:hypothetical protein
MNKYTSLERLALDAHRDGWTWHQFWREHGEAMRKAEPVNRARYHKMTDRLLCLLVSGDVDGHEPIGPDAEPPWEHDDALGEVSDTHTAARLQQGTLWNTNQPTD